MYKFTIDLFVSNAVDLNNNKIHVPLKTWNLNTGSTGLEHSIEESIPKAKVNYDITNGSLNCGVYTFFIRYQIDDYNYTKWFQITDDIIIINDEGKDVPIHNFLDSNRCVQCSMEQFFRNFCLPEGSKTLSTQGCSDLVRRECERKSRLRVLQTCFLRPLPCQILPRLRHIGST